MIQIYSYKELRSAELLPFNSHRILQNALISVRNQFFHIFEILIRGVFVGLIIG